MSWLASELRAVPARTELDGTRFGLFNEWVRALSYVSAIVGGAVFVDTAARYVGVLVLSMVGLARSAIGIAARGRRPQATSAFLDVVLCPILIMIGLGSPLFAALVGITAAGLMSLFVRIPPRLVIVGLTVGALGAGASAFLFEGGDPEGVSVAAAVFVAFVVSIGAGVLVFGWRGARRVLSAKEAELASILCEAPVILSRVGEDDRVMSVAGSAADPMWTVGSFAWDVFPRQLMEMVTQARTHGRVVGDLSVDGRSFQVTCHGTGSGVVVTGFDVTDREAARSQLEQIIRSKDEFVASISHELRTPLTAVLGFSTELRESGAVDPEHARFLDTVIEQSTEMAAIIEDLLVAARLDLDIFTAQRSVHLETEVEQVVRALHLKTAKPVNVSGCGGHVLADNGRVRQILRNLIVNADRYGGPVIDVELGVDGASGYVVVRDNGPEIPLEVSTRMFDAYQSTGRIQGRTAALGLGLSVSRHLAELMGGDLTYSHEHGWSRFRMTLPLSDERLERSA
jgi:signal transduction histidine kinase